jgi:hypothetical protein
MRGTVGAVLAVENRKKDVKGLNTIGSFGFI